jgi:cobaltochelatase CobS
MKKATWKDVDEIVKMTNDSKSVSLADLEVAIASSDDIKMKEIASAMRGPHLSYECAVYPFSGVTLSPDLQIARYKKWFEEGSLLSHLYNQAKLKSKDAKVAEEATKKARDKEEEVKRLKAELEATRKAKAEEDARMKAEREEAEVVVSAVADPSAPSGVRKTTEPRKPRKKKSGLPIRSQIKFDVVKPNPELSAYVPEEDKFYEFPEWTPEFVNLLDRGMNVWLYGGTGSGKSSLVEQVCNVGNLPVVYQSFHEEIKPDALFGGFRLEDGNTIWQDGPVTKAYREGHILLLDEIDSTPPEILFCLFAILDRKPLVLADNNCEVVKPHPNFRVVATGNTIGRGDDSGSYNGTNVLNRAFLNRFRIWYEVEYPSEEVYTKIIMKEGVEESLARIVASLAKAINVASMQGTLSTVEQSAINEMFRKMKKIHPSIGEIVSTK